MTRQSNFVYGGRESDEGHGYSQSKVYDSTWMFSERSLNLLAHHAWTGPWVLSRGLETLQLIFWHFSLSQARKSQEHIDGTTGMVLAPEVQSGSTSPSFWHCQWV